jgi:hypothetical protein
MSWKTTTLHGRTVPSWRWIIVFHAMWLLGGTIVGVAGTVAVLEATT